MLNLVQHLLIAFFMLFTFYSSLILVPVWIDNQFKLEQGGSYISVLAATVATIQIIDMREAILIAFCILSLNAFSQRMGRKTSPDDFIGTWELTKLADRHLNYRTDSFEKEILRFTKDSVFIATNNKVYAGTWKLNGGQPNINIKATNQFNYTWISGSVDAKFFTTKGLGYYKYFVRVYKS